MACDEGLAQLLRDDPAGEPVAEQKMFGGLAFLLGGHMVCGVHKGAAMFRVGKGGTEAALSIPGVAQMEMSAGRPMAGMVDASAEVMAEDARRSRLMVLALGAVRGLPPKVAKPAKG